MTSVLIALGTLVIAAMTLVRWYEERSARQSAEDQSAPAKRVSEALRRAGSGRSVSARSG